jgi:hypothetical protein
LKVRCNRCGEEKERTVQFFSAVPLYYYSTGFRPTCKMCIAFEARQLRARRREKHFAANPPAPMSEEITKPGVPPMSLDEWGEVETREPQPLQRDIPTVAPRDILASRILAIGDTHAPFAHPDAIDFLAGIKAEFSPDLVVHQGDEVDNHSMSFHEKNPALPGQGAELDESRTWIHRLEKLFPSLILLESNHGSLLYRKALHHGFHEDLLRNYNEVLRVGAGWRWQFSLTVDSPGGPIYFEHGQKGTARSVARALGMSVVQGHRHNEAYAEVWNNSVNDVFAMQTGCLIDNRSKAFLYNRKNRTHPVISTGIIIDGHPYVIRLAEAKSGRWDRRLGLLGVAA